MQQRTVPLLVSLVALLLSAALPPAAGAAMLHPAPTAPSTATQRAYAAQMLHLPARSAAFGTASGAEASLLSATDAGVVFEVRVSWEQLTLEPVRVGDREYVRVSLPGWMETTQNGAPALPMLAQAIAAPFGVGVSLRVVPGPAHTLALPAPPLPVATQRVEWPAPPPAAGVPPLPVPSLVLEEDPTVYAAAEDSGCLARVTGEGVVRQQRVVAIAVYPVQYRPATQELTVYEWLRVEVIFEGPPAARLELEPPAAESPVYERLFRLTLLNYEAARQWRRPPAGDLAGDSVETQAHALGSVWAPPVPGWRVKVREDGIYKLTYAELLAAGLPVATLDPRTFRLYNQGSEVAIHVQGQADGRFDAADYLLFYGQAVASKYTADNVYWLTYGQGTGLRMASREGTPGAAAAPAHYRALRRMEQSQHYVTTAAGDDDLERWLWDYVYPPGRPSWSYTLPLAAPHAAPATLRVVMLGYLQNAINPDHHVTILLNGTQVGDAWWDGITWKTVEMSIAAGLLVAGDNTISVVCPNDTGVGYDVVYVDRIELEFDSAFRAEGNVLAFSYGTSGTWKYLVDGFSSNELAVYDVTAPAAVARIEGIAVASSALGYALQFEDTVATTRAYWTGATNAYRTVRAIEADTWSSLHSMANGADYIVITHAAFAAQAQTLRDFRASQGLRAVVVDVQDVYDEFGYGLVGTAAIHDFLAYAYSHWRAPAPSFVVLLGDGHYDPKDYLGHGRVNYIPPYLAMTDPWVGEVPADNRYVTLVGTDNFPDMMLGRLAVNDGAEASAFVNKIIAYEQSPVTGEWRRQVLAVADNADPGGDFAALSDNLLAASLPAPYQAQKVYYGVTHTTVADARAAILGGINAGKFIVNFVGHAHTAGWASEGLFTATDVPALTNGGKLPVILSMTCRDGSYASPLPVAQGWEALAEVVTRAEGKGAIASWSPTGLGITMGHDLLDRGFFDARFRNAKRTLGEVTQAGKLNVWLSGNNLDLLDTYLLFGDPAQRLGLTGDLDADCDVDVVDIMLVAGRWNARAGDASYDARYDLDGDGYIGILDIMTVAARWNTRC